MQEQCTLMMRSLRGLQKPVWHLEDSAQMSWGEMELLDTKLKIYKAVVPTLLTKIRVRVMLRF